MIVWLLWLSYDQGSAIEMCCGGYGGYAGSLMKKETVEGG
jgi:hypothetical protein